MHSTNDDITVRNGSVVGFGSGGGVALLGNGELVEGVHVKSNLNGIGVNEGIVRRCSAVGNSGYGIQLYVGGLVEANLAISNGATGILVTGATVIGNASSGNGFGLAGTLTVYGSNSFQGNTTDVSVFHGVSQNNNSCNGTTC